MPTICICPPHSSPISTCIKTQGKQRLALHWGSFNLAHLSRDRTTLLDTVIVLLTGGVFPAQMRLKGRALLQPGVDDRVVVVRDDEPTSLVAFALSSR